MIKQNYKYCLPEVQKIGCFVRSCGAVAELFMHKELTATQINDLWIWGKKSGNIDFNDNVKHSAPIITKALKMLEGTGQFIEVATFRNGRLNYYQSVNESLKQRKKYFIQKIETNGKIGTHFRVVSGDGSLLFDPFFPDVEVKKILYSIVYVFVEE